MCLGIPMRIKSVSGEFAEVDAQGIARSVNIQMLPKVKKGDYVIVHAGFAIEKLNPAKAKSTLKLIRDEIY